MDEANGDHQLADKLTAKLAFSNQQIVEVIGSLQIFLRPVVITGQMTNLCADPKDDMVLECALASQATQVVSSDKKHLLSLKQFRGISIVSPAELIRMVEAAPQA
jgi:predicted nucleic acid-binding protein